jgi:hypothetical protein
MDGGDGNLGFDSTLLASLCLQNSACALIQGNLQGAAVKA